ncbi:hypothetical protein PRZ48_015169 [Zasmidium cellare]|uniref:Uncharacterized protein n=1 Tax=Zasmidium cellare TaxID=395010 RepID=A0ABR0DXS9_ZASCE|nr:hypothetical protein PRZ48_015169 [Zasmidium cellare]
MPPKRKQSTVFTGPGRVLGSGEEQPAKRPRKSMCEEQDAEYVPPQAEGQESDDDVEQKSNVLDRAETGEGSKGEAALIKGAEKRVHATRKKSRREPDKAVSRTQAAKKATETDYDSEDDYTDDSDKYDDFSFGSGAGRGFYKYGQGQRLGEAEDDVKEKETNGVDRGCPCCD